LPISISNISTALRVIEGASGAFLEKGQILNGKIVEVYQNNLAVINIKGSNFTAETPYRLEVGKNILLKVTGLSPRPTFSITGPEIIAKFSITQDKTALVTHSLASLMEGLSSLLGEEGALTNASSPVNKLFFSLFRIFYTGKGADSLKNLITLLNEGRDSGYIFNKGLKDEFLKLAGRGKGNVSRASKDTLEKLDNFLKSMDLPHHSSSGALYTIPFFFENEFGVASLHCEPSEKEKGFKGKKLAFRLNIEMSATGRVEASINLTGNGAAIIFKVENREAHSLIQKKIPALKKGIEKTGVKVVGVDVINVRGPNDSAEPREDAEADLDLFA